MRHVYVGNSRVTWCGAKVHAGSGNRLKLKRGELAPLTEEEHAEGFNYGDMCPECVANVAATVAEMKRINDRPLPDEQSAVIENAPVVRYDLD
jgi:hypothetical protein